MKNQQKKLFFIIGVGRSGTSLLHEIMNTFSGFCNENESKVGGSHSLSCWTPVRKSNDFSYLEKFIEKNWTDEYFVEKTPDSVHCLPALSKNYPEANYIFLLRNPKNLVLSQLNLYAISSDDYLERQYHIENLISNKSDLFLNPEQYYAKLTLDQIKQLIEHRDLFQNSITVKYEFLKESLDKILESLENKFGITKNTEDAHEIIARPSYSSKNVKHEIVELADRQAIEMTTEASKLLGYS